MSVVVVGLEHQQSPLELLERVTVSEADLPKMLGRLRDCVNLEESVLLSTCLRTEVYAVVDRFHDAVDEIRVLLAEKADLPVDEIESHLSIRFDDDVASHLFEVASGLCSAVPGESEVLGQVRRAWERAQGEHASGPVLADLFRHAVQTGRRVRSETAIARGTTSFSHAAVELAEQRLDGGLAGRNVVVVGAGAMGAGVFEALISLNGGRRPGRVVLANRTPARAHELAATAGPDTGVDVEVVPFAKLSSAIVGANAVFTALEADAGHLGALELHGALESHHFPLVVDLGVPRNIDRAAADAAGLTVLDLADLRSSVAHVMDDRRVEATRAEAIVDEEVDRYRSASRARGAAPVVAALRTRLESQRTSELERRRREFASLSDEDWGKVDALTKSVLAKLLHEPTMLLKETAGSPRGERLVEALRILFDL